MPNKVEDQALWGRLLRPFIIVLGLAVCVASGLAAWQRAAPLTAPALFPFSETWYAKAMAATAPVEGVADAQMAIKLAPARAENWMLLAYQYSRADRGISPRVIAAIRQSYIASPLDVDVSAYRLTFLFNAWPALPDDLRDQARNEARQFASNSERGLNFLRQAVPTIADSRTRLEFAIMTVIAHHQLDLVVQKNQKDH
jgi:hypothetical protein